MDIQEIRSRWSRPVHDAQANIAAWDDMAGSFGKAPLPAWDKDPFLMQLDREVAFSREMTVLDIGCGAGCYGIAIAGRVGRVVGIDISPKMLEYAKRRATEENIGNISFICGDFCDVAIEGKFDLVFAHMTPAVADAAAFEKMLSLASDYCYLVKPTRRTDSILDPLKAIAGGKPRPDSFDEGLLYAFMLLWQSGRLPSLSYRPSVWESSRDIDEAKSWYLNRLSTYHSISPEAREKILAYLDAAASGGRIAERTVSTIATRSWRMRAESPSRL
jgi:SAM-dependent methyltransferase